MFRFAQHDSIVYQMDSNTTVTFSFDGTFFLK